MFMWVKQATEKELKKKKKKKNPTATQLSAR